MAVILDTLRQEKKYRISRLAAIRLAYTLNRVLPPDPHNHGHEGYMVRSPYFDSICDNDFWEKIDRVDPRKKIRLRVYSPDEERVKLEMKEKNGIFQRKRSLTITRKNALSMINRDFGFLKDFPGPFAEELFLLLVQDVYMPRCLVQYQRTAFAVPVNDTRVTLDMWRESSESCYGLFSQDPCLHPVGSYDDVTLEVKYNHFLLGYVKDLLASCDKVPVAYSKYCMARNISHTPI